MTMNICVKTRQRQYRKTLKGTVYPIVLYSISFQLEPDTAISAYIKPAQTLTAAIHWCIDYTVLTSLPFYLIQYTDI